jgi:undecaprenyl diphosphate synthase
MKIPRHIGIIPDGNRRWAVKNGMSKEMGYEYGLAPGREVFNICQKLGVEELTYYGFTTDNVKRPQVQRKAFTAACIKAVEMLSDEDASLLVIGNKDSHVFPQELLPYTKRKDIGKGGMKVNFLVNYGWDWDLRNIANANGKSRNSISSKFKIT